MSEIIKYIRQRFPNLIALEKYLKKVLKKKN